MTTATTTTDEIYNLRYKERESVNPSRTYICAAYFIYTHLHESVARTGGSE